MNRLMRKVIASVLAVSVCLSSLLIVPVNAADSVEVETDFKVTGASIRFVENNTKVDGIRFGVGIKKEVYETLSEDQKANYRLLVMPTALVTGRLEIDEKYTFKVGSTTSIATPINYEIDWTGAKEKDGYMTVHVYLNNINTSYYEVDLTARAYYQEGNNGPVYSEALERSYTYVATQALNDVKDSNTGVYNKPAGDNYSPYTEIQRDALLGVKYRKTDTWDYDGEILSTSNEEENIHSLVLDREAQINSSSFIIETAFEVGVSEDTFVEQLTDVDRSIKGMIFGYDETTAAAIYLDFRYRSGDATTKAGWYPYLRVYNGTNGGWHGTVLGIDSPVAAGFYDFRISVDTTEGYLEVIVEYKTADENHYTTLLNSYGNENWKNAKHQIVGTRVGFCSTLEDYEVRFKPNIQVYNDTVQTRGKHSQKAVGELNGDGTGNIEGTYVVDYRTSKVQDKYEGIAFGGTSAQEGYTFYIARSNEADGFYVGMNKDTHTVAYSKIADAGLKLQDNDELLVDFDITISMKDTTRVFLVSYRIIHGETLIYECPEWVVEDTENLYTENDVYLYSEDTGLETGSLTGDGKTIFYPITVTANSSIKVSNTDTEIEAVNVDLKERERYTNPIPDKDQPYRDGSPEDRELKGFSRIEDSSMTGDPYILRYNGKYYLYVSNNSWYCTYKCWESLDLIHYTYLGEFNLLDKNGNAAENDTYEGQDLALECPWAPEVHYWNGEFYMYTSPHASGNKVLKSTTGLPYGDFKVVNDSLCNGIDGTIFIDDNEDKWIIRPLHDKSQGGTLNNGETGIVYPAAIKMSSMTSRPWGSLQYYSGEKLSKAGITGDMVEGPFVFKRDGIYYLIATGEQVGAPAYRLNYAYNNSGAGFTGVENWSTEMEPNVIINTEGTYDSYGHGAITIGPDLDSYWFPYHMTRSSNNARVMAISRVEFSGTRMSVLGQDKETFAPMAPAFYTTFFDSLSATDSSGKVTGVIAREAGFRSYTEQRTKAGEGLHLVAGQYLSGRLGEDNTVELIKTGSRFTAEYNFKNVATDGTFKCLFGGGYITINGKTVELYKGTTKIASAQMLVNGESGWNWSAYHDIIVAYESGRITVTIDGCTKIDEIVTGLGNGAIGYEGATLDQIGGAVFSNQAFGSSDQEVEKVAEGSFFASNYYEAKEGESATQLSGNSKLYTVTTTDEAEDVMTYTSTHDSEKHTYHIYKDATALTLAQGDRAVYKIDVAETGLYSLESLFSVNSDGSVIKIQVDGETPICYTLRKNNYASVTTDKEYYESLQFQKRIIGKLYLEKGLHTLTIKVVEGDYTAIEYEMNRISAVAQKYSNDLSKLGGGHYWSAYIDRNIFAKWPNSGEYRSYWSIQDGAHYTPATATEKDPETQEDTPVMVRSIARFGGDDFTDYKVKVDMKTDAVETDKNAGILLRATQPSSYWRQTYGSCKGYYVCMNQDGVSIMRFDYNETLVAHYDIALDKDTYYTLEAECVDNTIEVWLNGKKIMTYIDPYAFICGAAALYSNEAETYYKNLEINQVFDRTLSSYIAAEDKRYDVIEGAFIRTEDGVQTALNSNLMIDRTINENLNSLYTVETSFHVVADKSVAIKGIVLDYDKKDGSYMVLDYHYVDEAYRLYVRYFDGNAYTTVWDCGVTLTVDAWYDFNIHVINQNSETTLNIAYATGTEESQRISHTFDFAMSGRKVGYISTAANNMQFGVMSEVRSAEPGIPFPEEWKDALNIISN